MGSAACLSVLAVEAWQACWERDSAFLMETLWIKLSEWRDFVRLEWKSLRAHPAHSISGKTSRSCRLSWRLAPKSRFSAAQAWLQAWWRLSHREARRGSQLALLWKSPLLRAHRSTGVLLSKGRWWYPGVTEAAAVPALPGTPLALLLPAGAARERGSSARLRSLLWDMRIGDPGKITPCYP